MSLLWALIGKFFPRKGSKPRGKMYIIAMCMIGMKIKPSSSRAPSKVFVPCGHCAECRKAAQSQWCFRLKAEFLKLQELGWNLGFLTLTYNERHLPHIPKECFRDPEKFKSVPCFSRDDITRWVHRLRKWIWKMYHAKGMKYMVCSEYGSKTQRPHYHVILGVPPIVGFPGFFRYAQYAWSDKSHKKLGFTIPAKYSGGYDQKGNYHKPFQITLSATFAAAYAAKYTSKDLNYYVDKSKFIVTRKFKRLMPFHCQSQSLGLGFLDLLGSDEAKLAVLRDGFAFVGDSRRQELPIYIKNKLLFDNRYIYEQKTGKRLCRRYANEFFQAYRDRILEKKVESCARLIDQLLNFENWQQTKLDDKDKARFYNDVLISYERFSQYTQRTIYGNAKLYVCYYGLDFAHSFDDMENAWFQRYCDSDVLFQGTIDFHLWYEIQRFFGYFFDYLKFFRRDAEVTELDRIKAFHKEK